MLLQVICGALALLSQVVSGRGRPPREHDGDGVSNLQMLIPLLMEESEGERPSHTRPAPRYPDGPYSDIPAEAFFMEPSKTPEKHKSTKKQLAQFRAVSSPSGPGPGPSPASPPDAVVAGCVRYFQGRSAASSSSTEALLQLCTEVLQDARLEDVPHVHAEEPCAAQPPPRPRAEEPQPLGSLLHALLDLLHAGGGAQSRRRWLIMNSNHPDPQMRQYVDVEM